MKVLKRKSLVTPNLPTKLIYTDSLPTLKEHKIYAFANTVFDYASSILPEILLQTAKYYKPTEGCTLLARMAEGYERMEAKRQIDRANLRFGQLEEEKEIGLKETNIVLCADLVTAFDPFIELPPDQRVGDT